MTQPVPETVPSVALPPGTYALDPGRTTVRANVRAMFGLLTVHGTFRLKSGQVIIAADPGESSVRAVIDAGSYTSGNAKRDADVLSPGLLDARGFPELVFTGRGASPDGTGWVVAGSVTAHGTPAQAQVRISSVRVEGGTARFLASARLDRTSFGITARKAVIGRTVTVLIDAAAYPS
jgi:polyisoprenoid-binding protein YceI